MEGGGAGGRERGMEGGREGRKEREESRHVQGTVLTRVHHVTPSHTAEMRFHRKVSIIKIVA